MTTPIPSDASQAVSPFPVYDAGLPQPAPSRDLAELVLHMEMATEKGKRAPELTAPAIPQAAEVPDFVPTADQLWNNMAVMELNAELGLTLDQMLALFRAAAPTPTASAPKAEAATGEDLAVYQSIADNYEHATKPAPAVAEKVPLTDERIMELAGEPDTSDAAEEDIDRREIIRLVRAIERAHGIGSGSAQEGQANG